MDTFKTGTAEYKELLEMYINTLDEKALYGAEQLTKTFIKNNILPEEIVNMHIQALRELYPQIYNEVRQGLHFLLQTMISYGMAHQEYQDLREKQLALKSELSVAANMQTTLLQTAIPEINGLDIGLITVPAHQINGDFYHFIQDENDNIGIAIADVIGKGMPAALCMSMIKYSLESFPEAAMTPRIILKNLNRVVEKNVDPGMFITMFYGQYIPFEEKFVYSSAGHEPGFYFDAGKNEFLEMKTKGLVLGVDQDAQYRENVQQINKDDMIILLTDGVTECRKGKDFIEIDEVLEVIKQNANFPAQEMVTRVYKYFERLQQFELRDDFTLIILRKEV